jgi:5-methylcytosine-specific restriction endonuclease McrA
MLESLGYNERTDAVLATPAPALTKEADGGLAVADVSLVRRCCTCKATKPLEAFSLLRSDPLGRQPRCRQCSRAVNGAYNARPDVKAKRKAQQKARAAEKRAYDAARYKEKRAEIAAYQRGYYAANRETVLAAVKVWGAENKERVGVIKKNYKSRRRCQEVSGIATADLARWEAIQTKVCHWCARDCGDDHHVDHFIPLSKGGRHEIDNLVIACRLCNLRKSARMPDDFMALLLSGYYGEQGRATCGIDLLRSLQ